MEKPTLSGRCRRRFRRDSKGGNVIPLTILWTILWMILWMIPLTIPKESFV